MPRYRIHFYGRPIGSLSHYATELVVRELDAIEVGAAMLQLYETHEHLMRHQKAPAGELVHVEEITAP
jgi:hypothetical protein